MVEKGNPTDRLDPPLVASERVMLDAWLDFHRETLLWKCEGLSDSQLTTASAPPSALSLLGLVRHRTDVERGWFGHFMGLDDAPLHASDDDPDAEFHNLDQADPAADLEALRREIATYRSHAPGPALDDTRVDERGRTISLRWIYVHMIEEYARHNGHADLLRERLDGQTGD